jgi:hypothetical protein
MATLKQKLEYGITIALIAGAAAGWIYVIVNQHRQNDPLGIVKKHFLFYPEYSRGVWHEGPCPNADGSSCRDVTYTVPVPGCGAVTFDWSVYPGDDADKSWSYNGTRPHLDETNYPFYALLGSESQFIDSPAIGKSPPQTCQMK